MPPTYIGGLLASFLFLDHRNDLLICESCLHLSVLLLGGLYTNLEEFWGLRSELDAGWDPHLTALRERIAKHAQ